MGKTARLNSVLIGLVCVAAIAFGWHIDAGAQSEVVKVGTSVSLSGRGATWGVPNYRTMEFQCEEINKAGGLKIGGKTYTLKQVAMDNKYTPDDSVAVATKLMEEHKVQFFVPCGGVPTLASLPVVKKYKALIFSGGSGKGIVSPENPYLFRADPTPSDYGAGFWKLVREKYPEIRRRVGISPDHETGWDGAKSSERGAKAAGIETVAPQEFVDANSIDFSSLLIKLLKQKPDIIDCPTVPGAMLALIVKQARELGYTGRINHIGTGDADMVLARAGAKGAEGVIFPTLIGDPFPPKIAAFKQKYTARWGEWNPASLVGTIYVDLLVAGLKAANSTDVDKVKAALEKPGFRPETTLFGAAYFGGKELYGINHQLLYPIPVSEIRNGKLVYIGTYNP
jgi:branched-chain amino acid transport system substrate-binding protein